MEIYKHIKVGDLYHHHIHPGTTDFPQTILCLEINKGLIHTYGMFLNLESLEIFSVTLSTDTLIKLERDFENISLEQQFG